MKCLFCRTEEPRADKGAKAVLCGSCVARLAGAPAGSTKARVSPPEAPTVRVTKAKGKKVTPKQTVGSGKSFGRGWHLRKHFVAPDGTVYSFGKQV